MLPDSFSVMYKVNNQFSKGVCVNILKTTGFAKGNKLAKIDAVRKIDVQGPN